MATIAPPKTCISCGRKPALQYRKLCGSCANSIQRYGRTPEQQRQWLWRVGKLCVVCATRVKSGREVEGRPLCRDCYTALRVLSDPNKRANIVKFFGSVKDTETKEGAD